MFTGGFGLHYGLQRLGCAMIPAGSGNTERHIQMIEDYGTTVLVATPSYAMHICEVGEKMGYDWEKSPLRVGLFGGEPCPPGLKAEIERRMHIVCTDNYGLTEVMGPGSPASVWPSATSSISPRITSCGRSSIRKPASRWARARWGVSCSRPFASRAFRCCATAPTIGPPCTPSPAPAAARWPAWTRCALPDDMLIIRGVNVFPSQIEDVLTGIEEVTPHYHIIVETRGGMDALIVETELRPEAFRDSFEAMGRPARPYRREAKGTLLVAPEVRLVELGGIERAIGKAKHVDDRREK